MILRWIRKLALSAILVLATAAIVVIRLTVRDYQSYFLAQKGTIVFYETKEITQTDLSKTYDVRIHSSQGVTVSAWVRFPLHREGPFPAVLISSGIETGHLVIELLDERPAVIAMAIRYPYKGDPDFSGWKAISTILDMREIGMKTVPSMLPALDYLHQHPSVDTNDIAVATVSFGTFVGVPAAALHPAVKRLIVVQGGGDITTIIAANAERLDMPLLQDFPDGLENSFSSLSNPTTTSADSLRDHS